MGPWGYVLAHHESGALDPDANQIVWHSDPLPNDPIVVRAGFDEELAAKIQEIGVNISEEQAETVLPKRYTGFVSATLESYKIIEDAGIAVGKIEK